MNYAIIGCGRIAFNHLKAATSNNLNIIAFCDIVPSQMDQLRSKSGLNSNQEIVYYTDYKIMLVEHPEIELVAIATESGEHARIALDCIGAGKHVIIEKPMAMSITDADEIIKKSEEAGVVVSACHQNRFNVAVRKTREAIEADRFGRMSHGSVHVRWNRGLSYYNQAPWRGTWAQDGGCLMNQCIHGIDLLRWMMGGRIVSVYAQTRQRFHDYLEAEDVGVAVLVFENGSIATIEGTTNVFPKNLEETLYLFGEKGTVKIGGTSTNNIDVWDFSDETDLDVASKNLKEQTSNIYGNGHASLYADVIDSIISDRKPYVDARAGRDALEVVLAIYQSQKTGLPVRLPLHDFSSIDMLGMFNA